MQSWGVCIDFINSVYRGLGVFHELDCCFLVISQGGICVGEGRMGREGKGRGEEYDEDDGEEEEEGGNVTSWSYCLL